MAFSCELLCRACMEPFQGNSMPLMNKKKKRKTPICSNFEEITSLKVKENDQLPQQLCLSCVSELNRCSAFREKCVRTNSTLRTYLDLESEDDGPVDSQITIAQQPPEKMTVCESKENTYEEIEVTQEMLNAAKSQGDVNTDMVLEMEEITNLLNPTCQPTASMDMNEQTDDNQIVFIIQDVSDANETPRLIPAAAATAATDNQPEKKFERYKCSICEMEFVRRKNFDNHMRRFHDGTSEDLVPRNKRLRLRLTREKDNVVVVKQELEENPEAKKCKTCGALYLNEKSLKLHERRNACTQESYSCDVCSKIFTDQTLFTEHTKSHPQQEVESKVEEPFDPLKKFMCNLCPKSFRMMSTLKDHVRTHTGDKPYKCTICGRGFSQNTNLKQHLRRHTQIKPFKCNHEDCEASFVSKGELDSHTRKHTGDHPFTCEQCGTGFTTSSSLVKHKRIHSGEKPYACDFCPMRFTALGTLRNHTRTHTGEKPHKCTFCDRCFTQKSDMSAHERTHTGDRPFVCKICNSAFHQSGTLKTHLRIHKKHEENVEEEDEQDVGAESE